jgi:hypothetical protein
MFATNDVSNLWNLNGLEFVIVFRIANLNWNFIET